MFGNRPRYSPMRRILAEVVCRIDFIQRCFHPWGTFNTRLQPLQNCSFTCNILAEIGCLSYCLVSGDVSGTSCRIDHMMHLSNLSGFCQRVSNFSTSCDLAKDGDGGGSADAAIYVIALGGIPCCVNCIGDKAKGGNQSGSVQPGMAYIRRITARVSRYVDSCTVPPFDVRIICESQGLEVGQLGELGR